MMDNIKEIRDYYAEKDKENIILEEIENEYLNEEYEKESPKKAEEIINNSDKIKERLYAEIPDLQCSWEESQYGNTEQSLEDICNYGESPMIIGKYENI